MNEQDYLDDDLIGEDGEDGEWEDDETEPLEVRTAVLAKNDLLALLCLKTSSSGGVIVRVDPRESLPSAQTYDDSDATTKWFNRSLATSKRNGWSVVYVGKPLYG